MKTTKVSKVKAVKKVGIQRTKSVKAKAPRKMKTIAKTTAVAEDKVNVQDVVIPRLRKFPAVAMTPRQIPGTEMHGMYAPVKVELNGTRPLPVVWVRVTHGNERHGKGIVVHADPAVSNAVGATLSFTGGGKTYPAKALSQ
jgi:hypothetical protein